MRTIENRLLDSLMFKASLVALIVICDGLVGTLILCTRVIDPSKPETPQNKAACWIAGEGGK